MLNGAYPPFDLAEGGIPLMLLRALAVLALFSAAGTAIFRALAAGPALAKMPAEDAASCERALRRLVRTSIAVHLAALAGWLVAQAAALADAGDLGGALAAVPDVLALTSFGHLVVVQGVVALLLAALYGRRDRLAAGTGILAVLLQAGHSHALAMSGAVSLGLASDAIHLLAASSWLGGLVPLLLVVRIAPPNAGCLAARWFSPYGKVAVGAIAVTALYQGWSLIGGLAGIVGTAYGWMAVAKFVLLLVLVGFAWANRYRLAPALRSEDGETAKRRLVVSIAMQTGFGVAVVVAAATLSSLPPALHTQPVWPFTQQFSLDAIQEDADFRREVVGAVLALAGAVLVLAVGIVFRRLRWPAVVAALVIAWFAIPHLDLLLAEASPTSFYRSTTGFAAASIVAGANLYPEDCQSCHGTAGKGDGPLAKTLAEPPADLTAGHLWGHSDGQLFWWLSHGIEGPEGDALVMPGFAATLSEDERWNLIDFIRARNAGGAYATSGNWPAAIAAPGFTASCPAGATSLASLHGKVVRLAFVGPGGAALPPVPADADIEIVTVIVPLAGYVPPPGCVASDPAIAASYGLVSGVAPDALAGTQFLIDPDGWLRAMQRPGETVAAGWDDPTALLAEINQICRHPLASAGGADAHHHHEE